MGRSGVERGETGERGMLKYSCGSPQRAKQMRVMVIKSREKLEKDIKVE